MFKISQSATFRYPVKFSSPKEDGTGRDENSFFAIFKRLTIPQITAITDQEGLTDASMAKQVMVGWADITDDAGNQIEFSSDVFDGLLQRVGFAAAIASAFMESIKEAPRKN